VDTFYNTDLQISTQLQELRKGLKENSDEMTGNAKNIYSNLDVLRGAMEQYFQDFTVETVASKITEDLKPILLKFVDDSVLAPGSLDKNDSGIFQEIEEIITLNKNNGTEENQNLLEKDG